ncbi:LysR family transcriptional regulator (chromosome initiation inhibitor) [Kitasatospora sp. MAP12-15]|uniref:LysR family transcriptional regulator ArgP n=1 Tax=unclassified Kitasatospora TaxID=2633591 RepID=UPI002474A25D|nr:LysR family transcriptional regulator ArgP [Kitasatospora sp. MAP12-44]MDH6108339.1 LysR family transcriptional regulator (chromosome initiation inhibitor) [Kitasatospora sp. MAP12-44]
MTGLPLEQVRTLLAAADEGTFEAAARALQLTPSAVSQRIKALEERTGRVLLLRSKPIRLTDSGEVVVRFARQVARLERDAGAELGLSDSGEPARVSIAVNADSLATWFLPALARAGREARICLEVHREDEEHTTRLLREGTVMAAVTSSPQPVQGCSVRALGRMRYRAMASPEFVDRWLRGAPLRQLLGAAPVVVFDRRDELQDRFLQRLNPRAATGTLRHFVPASESYLDAVVSGLGWGMLPEIHVAARAVGGRLRDLAPDRPIDVPLYWQQWKLDSPALAEVADAVAAAAADAL